MTFRVFTSSRHEPISRYTSCKSFSHSVGSPSTCLIVSLAGQQSLSWKWPCFSSWLLLPVFLTSCSRHHCQIQCHDAFLPFSSLSFMVLGFLWRIIIYFQLIFVCGRKEGSSFLLCMWYPIFPSLFIEETVLSRSGGIGTLWKIIWPCMERFIWGLSLLFLWSMCVSLCLCQDLTILFPVSQ